MFKNYKESNVELKTRTMTQYETKGFMLFTMIDFNKIKDEISENFIYKVIEKRIKFFELSDKISEDVIPYIVLFSGGNPGKAVVILIDILNLSEDSGRKITKADVGIKLYPDGCYTDDTFYNLVDLCKDKKVRYSEIY